MQNNRPIYLQIADRIADDILAGRLTAEGRIPSVREQAAESQVNVNTVARTYETLEREGIIFNRRGMGYYVSPDAVSRITAARNDAFFNGGEMDFIFNRLRSVGLSPERLAELYNDFLSANK